MENHMKIENQMGSNYVGCNISKQVTFNVNSPMLAEYFKDRPIESSTLKRIKENTFITLKDCHKNNYIKTRAYHEGLKRLTEQSIIGIIGAAGDGKSVLCKIIAHQFIKEHTEYISVILTKPSEFNEIPFVEGCKYLIIIDDMFGKHVINENKLYTWEEIFDQIQKRIRLGQLAVIYSMREYVFKTCQYKINQYDIFYGDSKYIRLHSEFALDMEEKTHILDYYKHSKNTEEVRRTITRNTTCFGFPAIASFNSKFNRNDRQGIYNSVTEFLLLEIETFWFEDKHIYTALLLIFCLQPVFEEELKSASLYDIINLTPKIKDIINLKPKIKELYKDFEMAVAIDKCSDLSQTFIQFVEQNLNIIYSLQEYVSEAFLKHFSERKMGMVLEYCPLQLLLSMTVLTNSDDTRHVVIKPFYYEYLSQRFLREIKSGNNDMFDHPAFINSEFLKKLLEQDSSGLMRTFNNIILGKIRDSEDRGNILHYIIVYGDVKCLHQLGSNDILTSCIRSKTSSGNNCQGLSVMSSIQPLKKLQLLQEYDAPMPVDLPHMAVQSHDSDIIKYVAQKMNVETLLDSNTILHSACNADHDVIEIVEFIFQNSQIDINAQNKDGFTALHLAARRRKLKTVNYLLSRGSSVDIQDNQGRLPLHLSVSSFTGRRDIRAAEIISILLKSGSDMLLKDNDGRTAFEAAMYASFPSAIELMMYNIPSVNSDVLNVAACYLNADWFERILRRNMTDHSTVEPTILFNCCKSGRDTVGKLKLLKSRGVSLNRTTDDLVNILHICCLQSSFSAVKYIVEELNIDIHAKDKGGFTPLILSTITTIQPIEKLKLLLEKGASKYDKDGNGRSLLHYSCQNGQLDVMNYVIDELGLNWNDKDSSGAPCLFHCAISKIHPIDKMKLLLGKGASKYDEDDNGRSLLYYSCIYGQLDVMNYVIDELGLDWNDRDSKGVPCLFYSAMSNIQPTEKIKLLLSKGASKYDKDVYGCSLLHYSCQCVQLEVVKCVIDELGLDWNDKDSSGSPCLFHCAISEIHPIDKMKLLLGKGASKYDKDDNGCSLLHYSCRNGQLDVVNYIIDELGLDWKDKDSNGAPCLFHCAISEIHPIEKMKLFLGKGASKYDKGDNGLSLLHYSCQCGQLEVVKCVIDELDLDWNDKDSSGSPCLFHCAISKIHPIDKMELLLAKGASKYDKNDNGRSLLYYSCIYGQLDVMNYIIDELDLDWNDTYSKGIWYLLYCSMSEIHPIDKIKLLLVKGASPYDKNDKADSLLNYSCKYGQLEVMNYVIDEPGLNWNDKDSSGAPCLFHCAMSEIHPIKKMKLLLGKGASKYDRNGNGCSLLHHSCEKGQLDVVNYVIDELGLDWKDTDSSGAPCLFYCAISEIHPIDKMKLFLVKGASKYDKDDNGCSLLHHSCEKGQIEVVNYVIDELGLDWNDTDSSGVPCLFYCASSKIHPIDKMKLFLVKGASKSDKNDIGRSLLHYSCREGQLEVVNYVIDELGLDWNDTDSLGNRCLFHCVVSKTQPIKKMKLLLGKGASKYDKAVNGCSLLHLSCQHGQLEVMNYVIDELGLDWNDKDSSGVPCLFHCAVSDIHPIDKMTLLFVKGATKYDKGNNGCSLLHYSCFESQLDVVKYVMEELGLDWNDKDSSGVPCLFYCAMSEIHPIDKMKLFLGKGACKYDKGINGCSLLHYSCFESQLDVVKFVIEDLNLNVNDKNNRGLMALFYAAESTIQPVEKLRLLSEKSAFKSADSLNKTNAVVGCCLCGSLAAVKYLVDVEGLDVNCRDSDNLTPLLAACKSDIEKVEKIGFLISKGAQIIICRPYKDYFSEQ